MLVDMDARVNHFDNCFVEQLKAGLSHPLVFDSLQLLARFARLLSGHHEVVKGLESRIGDAEDKAMVSIINGGCDESRGFGVCSGYSKEVGTYCDQYVESSSDGLGLTHDICLGSNSDKAIDMLAYWY